MRRKSGSGGRMRGKRLEIVEIMAIIITEGEN